MKGKFRSAITGQYVDPKAAARHPRTTVKEMDDKERVPPKRVKTKKPKRQARSKS